MVLQHALLRLRFIFVCTFLDTSLCAVVGQGYIYKNTIIKALKIVRNGEGVGWGYIYVIVIVLGVNSMVSSIIIDISKVVCNDFLRYCYLL